MIFIKKKSGGGNRSIEETGKMPICYVIIIMLQTIENIFLSQFINNHHLNRSGHQIY